MTSVLAALPRSPSPQARSGPMAQHDLSKARPSRYVWFGSFDSTTPVFHAYEPITGAMACGIAEVTRGCFVPLRHATRFGRPCTRCWTPS